MTEFSILFSIYFAGMSERWAVLAAVQETAAGVTVATTAHDGDEQGGLRNYSLQDADASHSVAGNNSAQLLCIVCGPPLSPSTTQ